MCLPQCRTCPCQDMLCNSRAHEVFCCREPREYLRHVMNATNMSCLTPEGAISGECDFLSANMYARSLFGECLASYRGGSHDLIISCLVIIIRGGRAGESECGANGGRYHHRPCQDSQQDAGHCPVTWRPDNDG